MSISIVRVKKEISDQYLVEDVKKGENIEDNIYLLDNFIFRIENEEIKDCIYALHSLKRDKTKLLRLFEKLDKK